MTRPILIYGATGYTAKLTARRAKALGKAVILAGRNAVSVRQIAESLDLPWAAAALDDAAGLDRILGDVAAVLHMAGPFSRTSKAMADACLRNKVHYLDITGEIDVFEALAARDDEARKAGIVLMPGVGFDVVPSDCLARHVAERLPGAERLYLGIQVIGMPSRGTARTMVDSIGTALRFRRDGALVTAPAGSLWRQFDYGHGPALSVGVGWGDVATAYRSTGIGSIETYFKAAPAMIVSSMVSRVLGGLMTAPGVQRFLNARIDSMPEGPDERARARGRAIVVAIAEHGDGRAVESRLTTPEGYEHTSHAALDIALKVAAGEVAPGFKTPSLGLGADYVLSLPGVSRLDVR